MAKGRKKKKSISSNNKKSDGYENIKKGKQSLRASGKKKKKNYEAFTDSSGSDEQFRRDVESDGSKTIIEMDADGNCLFRSLSDQLYWDYGHDHETIRSEVCDFMEEHEEEFIFFLVLDDDDEDASDFKSYISSMRESGEWGGNLELVAAAKLYRRRINVLSLTASYTIEYDKKSSGPDLMVSYHDNDHYNSVRDSNGKKPPPKEYIIKPDVTDTTVVLNEEEEGISANLLTESSDNNMDNESQGRRSKVLNENDAETKTEGKRKKPKPGGPCPCGSGKSYRKCCRSTDKRKATEARRKNNINNYTDGDNSKIQDDVRELLPTSIDDHMESGFKLLKI